MECSQVRSLDLNHQWHLADVWWASEHTVCLLPQWVWWYPSMMDAFQRNLSSPLFIVLWEVVGDSDFTHGGTCTVGASCWGRIKYGHASLKHCFFRTARQLWCGSDMFPLKVHEFGVALRMFFSSVVAMYKVWYRMWFFFWSCFCFVLFCFLPWT